MKLWVYGVGVLLGVSVLWVMSGTEREKPLLDNGVGASASASLGALEANATAYPNEPGPTLQLAQAYLDARQPGLARVLIESSNPLVKADVRVQHVMVRALVDQGHNGDALAVERAVLAACRTAGRSARCDDVLAVSARRRVGILEEMVASGVNDAQAQPEMSYIAYKNATREARVSLQ